MTTLLHGKREKKNVTREITFIKLRLLSVTSHVARVVNRNRANKTAVRKIISTTVFSTFYNYSSFVLYTRARSDHWSVESTSVQFWRVRVVQRERIIILWIETSFSPGNRTTFRRFNPSKILPQSLLDESLGEKLYNDSAQRETYIGIIKFCGTVS